MKRFCLVLILVGILFTGCSMTAVQHFTEPRNVTLYDSQTTIQQVVNILGQPDYVHKTPYGDTHITEEIYTWNLLKHSSGVVVVKCNASGTCTAPDYWPKGQGVNTGYLKLLFINGVFYYGGPGEGINKHKQNCNICKGN